MTVRHALRDTAQRLIAAGREDGDAIARALIEEVVGAHGTQLLLALDKELTPGQQAVLLEYASRAEGGEPVQYILRSWDFYGRTFRTDPRALIPRPETELLVEHALARLPAGAAAVLDAGTGTGCIGITLKLEQPVAQVTLCDVSADVLALAGENATLLGADVSLLRHDMRQPFPGGPYDMIVSNPPYITAEEMTDLSPVVGAHEPHLALYGGQDGLDFVRALAQRALESLKPGGWLLLEVGWKQAVQAAELLAGTLGFAQTADDLAGIPRNVLARRD